MFDTIAFGALVRAKRGLKRVDGKKMSQQLLASEVFGDPSRKSDISRIENGKLNPQEATVRAICDVLSISEAELATIRQSRPSAKQLDQIPTLSLKELQTLAAEFRHPDAFEAIEGTLRPFLTEKADDYRRLLRDIDDLKNASSRFDNMRAAATEALSELDFDKAEELLESAREIIRDQLREPLDLNAKLSERQAEIALLRNDPDHAFTLLSAAADSFAALDPLEPARKRNSYGKLLHQHGLRNAGPALALSVQMTRSALAAWPRDADDQLWAAFQNNLGLTLQNLGNRTGDTDLMHQAITAFRASLEVRTRNASEMQWAMTQNNLGAALKNLGASTDDTDLMHQAITAFRAALEVYTRDANEMDWAMTQNNVGNALQELGNHTEDKDLLDQAITAFRAALEVHTRSASEMNWARAQNNLGNALVDLGNRTGDTDLMHQAITAFRASLEVRTRNASEMQWAMTQNNLATAFLDLANGAPPDLAKAHLSDAINLIDNALEVFTPQSAAYFHQMASDNRTDILYALNALP